MQCTAMDFTFITPDFDHEWVDTDQIYQSKIGPHHVFATIQYTKLQQKPQSPHSRSRFSIYEWENPFPCRTMNIWRTTSMRKKPIGFRFQGINDY